VTIQDLGSIGELLAAVATIATLAYLAIQIRNSTQAARATAADRATAASNQVNVAVFSSSELTQLWFQGLREYETLSSEQQDQFDIMAIAYLNVLRNDFSQAAEGVLPPDMKRSNEALIIWFASQRGFAVHFWPKYHETWPPNFSAYVDRAIEKGPHAAQQGTAADSA